MGSSAIACDLGSSATISPISWPESSSGPSSNIGWCANIRSPPGAERAGGNPRFAGGAKMPDHGTLTIGIDCRYIHDRLDGIARYISQLVAGLCAAEGGHRIVAFVDAARRLPDAIVPPSAKLRSHAIPIPVFHPRGLWAWQPILREQPIDLFHAPYHAWAPA